MHQNVVAFHAANGMLNKDTDLTQDCIGSLLLSAPLRVGIWLLRCVSSTRIYAGFRIDAREIYSFSMTYQALFANLIKSLAIFTSNGAWFHSNLTKRPTRFEGSHHVPNETIRHQTSQSQKTPSTQSPRTP